MRIVGAVSIAVLAQTNTACGTCLAICGDSATVLVNVPSELAGAELEVEACINTRCSRARVFANRGERGTSIGEDEVASVSVLEDNGSLSMSVDVTPEVPARGDSARVEVVAVVSGDVVASVDEPLEYERCGCSNECECATLVASLTYPE